MDQQRIIPLAKEGYPFIAAGIILTLISFFFLPAIITILLALLTVFVIYFFRDPERAIPVGEQLIISPADGKVVDIKPVTVNNSPYNQISIFLSIFNVHVNRSPLAGTVTDKHYNPGKFLVAFAEKASEVNEQTALTVASGKQTIIVKQIAGLIARRIVCRVNKGDALERGQRFGLIRFGSRVDLLIPSSCKLRVAVGEKVKGGSSIIGEVQ